MTNDELEKRVDQEIAQIHARLDNLAAAENRLFGENQAAHDAYKDKILETLHDQKNALEGHRLRLESLEKHPPAALDPLG